MSQASFQRTLKTLGVVFITLSCITPASAVFVIAPGIIQQAGTGAVWGLIIAAFISLAIAFVYAELASAFPFTGGEYAIVGRVLGPCAGFVTLGLCVVTGLLPIAVLALGLSTYLIPFIPWATPVPTAIASVALTTLIAILHIRTNAFVTGLFLLTEMVAVVVLTWLGFAHMHRPVAEFLLTPQYLGQDGMLMPATLGVIGLAVSVGIFAFNGYGQAVYLGEETHEPGKRIARAILFSLFAAILPETVPVIALLAGAPDLKTLFTSSNMIGDFIASAGGENLETAISIGIVLAIINANIAITIFVSRVLFSTGRDHVWNAGLNRWLVSIHGRTFSPWAATLACGILASAACFTDLNLLLVLTGTGLIGLYGLMCIAALAGRRNGKTAHREFHMPLYPLAPVLALAAMGYIVYVSFLDPEVGRPSLMATAGIIVLSLLYYTLVLRRRGDWKLRGPDL